MRRLFNIDNPLVQWKNHANVSSLGDAVRRNNRRGKRLLHEMHSSERSFRRGTTNLLSGKRFYPLEDAAEGIPVRAQGKDFGRGLIVDHATVHVLSDLEAFSNCPNVM